VTKLAEKKELKSGQTVQIAWKNRREKIREQIGLIKGTRRRGINHDGGGLDGVITKVYRKRQAGSSNVASIRISSMVLLFFSLFLSGDRCSKLPRRLFVLLSMA
jgi:hypothetical protein